MELENMLPVSRQLSEIAYRGQKLTQRKLLMEAGQQRSWALGDVLETIRPLMPECGITRVADITRLDRLAIPVTLAVRPNSLTLSTASGKGLSLKAAVVSGLMEAIELHTAESAQLNSVYAPFKAFSNSTYTIDPLALPQRKGGNFRIDWPELWGFGWDIVNNCETIVPLRMLLLRYLQSPLPSLAQFPIDSNGLASGATLAEAILSALLEVIERDAISCHMTAHERYSVPLFKVDVDSIMFPSVLEVYERIEAGGGLPVLYDCAVDTDIPVYKALIYDRDRSVPPAGGYGAHLDPQVAMLRALTEAAQGRAVVISGARDDVFAFDLTWARSIAARLKGVPPSHRSASKPLVSLATETFEGDIQIVISRLRRIGLNQVVITELTLPGFPIHVVKAIVPGLEGYKAHSYIPCKRALEFGSRLQTTGANQSHIRHSDFHLPAGGIR